MTDNMTQIERAVGERTGGRRHANPHGDGDGQSRLMPRLSHIHGCGSKGGPRVTPRPTRDGWLLSVALETARRSTCVRRHYGAVVATPAGEIISTGYNGAPRGQPHCAEVGCRRQALGIPQGERYELCRAVHAEMNALLQAGRAAEGCTLYLAGYAVESGLAVDATPCLLCARVAVNRGIAEVVMRRVPPRQPARADPVAILASLEEAAEGAARVTASRGIGAEERQIGGSRP